MIVDADGLAGTLTSTVWPSLETVAETSVALGAVRSLGSIARIEPLASVSLSSGWILLVRPGADPQVVGHRLGRLAHLLVVDDVLVLLVVVVVLLGRRDERVPVVDLLLRRVEVPDVAGVELVEDDVAAVDAERDAVADDGLADAAERAGAPRRRCDRSWRRRRRCPVSAHAACRQPRSTTGRVTSGGSTERLAWSRTSTPPTPSPPPSSRTGRAATRWR